MTLVTTNYGCFLSSAAACHRLLYESFRKTGLPVSRALILL